MARHELDAVLIGDEYNMQYHSGANYEGYFLMTPQKNYILTDSRYTVVAERDAVNCEVMTLGSGQNYPSLVSALLRECGAKRVGFEDLHLTYALYQRFAQASPRILFVPVGEELNRLREVKDAQELEFLAKAEEIGDTAFEYVRNHMKVGMTEIEVALMIENTMRRNGAEGLSFDTIVASGLNGSMPHAVPGMKKLEEGDFVTMDFGCRYHGYCSDMTRTVVMGKASEKQKEIYDTVLKAQLAALDAVRAGVTGKSVDAVARNIIAEAGYGEYFGHGLGHSVGLFIHENPRLSPNEERLLQENVIVTVEPGIYIPGFGGVRIEDMVAVTADGHVNFAHSPKELIEII